MTPRYSIYYMELFMDFGVEIENDSSSQFMCVQQQLNRWHQFTIAKYNILTYVHIKCVGFFSSSFSLVLVRFSFEMTTRGFFSYSVLLKNINLLRCFISQYYELFRKCTIYELPIVMVTLYGINKIQLKYL